MMSLISMIFLLIVGIIIICLYMINGCLTTIQIYLIAFVLGMILNEICLRFESRWWDDEEELDDECDNNKDDEIR